MRRSGTGIAHESGDCSGEYRGSRFLNVVIAFSVWLSVSFIGFDCCCAGFLQGALKHLIGLGFLTAEMTVGAMEQLGIVLLGS